MPLSGLDIPHLLNLSVCPDDFPGTDDSHVKMLTEVLKPASLEAGGLNQSSDD